MSACRSADGAGDRNGIFEAGASAERLVSRPAGVHAIDPRHPHVITKGYRFGLTQRATLLKRGRFAMDVLERVRIQRFDLTGMKSWENGALDTELRGRPMRLAIPSRSLKCRETRWLLKAVLYS